MKSGMICWMWVSVLAMLTVGCARFSNQQGVDNLWRAADAPAFQSGTTTQQDVMDALGPPSQIISLPDGSVFYYLREFGGGRATVLIVYNDRNTTIEYDRAVFFFDAQGVLTKSSYSKEEAPRS